MITGRGFEGIEKRFEGLEQRFEGLEQRFDGLEQRFDGLEKKVDDGFRHVNARLDTIRRDIADLDDLRERVQTLETHAGLARKI